MALVTQIYLDKYGLIIFQQSKIIIPGWHKPEELVNNLCAYMYRNPILDLNKSFFSEVKQQSCRPILDKHLQTQHAPTAKQL